MIVSNDVARRRLKPVMVSGLSSHIMELIKNRMISSVKVDFIVTSHINGKSFGLISSFTEVTAISIFDSRKSIWIETVKSGSVGRLRKLQRLAMPMIVSGVMVSTFFSGIQPTALGGSP